MLSKPRMKKGKKKRGGIHLAKRKEGGSKRRKGGKKINKKETH
jgi:hypothetical protein